MNIPVRQSTSRRLGQWSLGITMAIIGIAGVFKAIDLPAFMDTVQTWKLLGSISKWLVVLALPPLEMLLAVLWFLKAARNSIEAASAVLLVMFGATYTAHLIFTDPPRCGCFGLIDEYFKGLSEGKAALLRDAAMLTTLLTGMWLSRKPVAPVGKSALPMQHEVNHATG